MTEGGKKTQHKKLPKIRITEDTAENHLRKPFIANYCDLAEMAHISGFKILIGIPELPQSC